MKLTYQGETVQRMGVHVLPAAPDLSAKLVRVSIKLGSGQVITVPADQVKRGK